jgi:cytidyltransferase-like protein
MHVGHLRMCEDAHNHADIVVWILNNDNWLVKKKNYAFIDEQSRLEIMRAFRAIDVCFLTSHQENCQDMSVCAELTLIQPDIFANGGDRKSDNIPEYVLCDNLGIEMMFGVGGEKIQSSSDLVRNAISKMSI